jgi:hypothetical protein
MRSHRRAIAVFKEPLLQFLLLGLLLFGVDRIVQGKAVDPRRIVVDDAKYAEIAAQFEEAEGRAPRPEEVPDLIVKWSQNEVLYREARLMGLDQGDDMIRQRLLLKLRNILFSNIVTQPPPDAELQAWFEARREQYDRAARVDFEQFLLPGGIDAARGDALAQAIGSGPAPAEHEAAVRRYYERPESNVFELFGAAEGQRLVAGADGTWQLLRSSQGLHLARVTRRYPLEPARFEEIRPRVAAEFREAQKRVELAAALKEIVDRYDIRVERRRTPDAAEPAASAATLRARPSGASP